jgi:hypothetical protein
MIKKNARIQSTASARILDRDPIDEIKKAFSLFDDEGKGRISLRNLRRVARELGEEVDDEELQAMIDEFDLNHDGESKSCSITHPFHALPSHYLTAFSLPPPLLVDEQEFIAIMTDTEP